MKTLCAFVILTGLGYSLLSINPPVAKQAYSTPSSQAISVKGIKKETSPQVSQTAKTPTHPIVQTPPPRKMYAAVGSASSESVTTAVEFFQARGLTNVGVAYLVGNFAAESGLKPDNHSGDGGIAWGIAQWHPQRRVGLPETLDGQLEFAWREIQAYPLKSAVYGTDEGFLMSAIRRYEGYSVEGNRFVYAKQLMGEIR